MAEEVVHRTIRAPGRFVVTPTTAFATTSFPYGGTRVGMANKVSLQCARRVTRIDCEGLGAAGDAIEGPERWVVSCNLRGWDNDAVQQFLARGYSAGTETQHSLFSAPGSRVAGQSRLALGLKIAFVPDDHVHGIGFILYRAVPHWGDGAELAFRRQDEAGIALSFECFHDASNRILKIGKLADLAL